jgi:DNA-binding transcriptional ArsR family regulator
MRAYKHPPAEQLSLERLMYALSDPVRLEIVRHLARKQVATCSDLDGGRPKSTMSHHFRVLREAGLVETLPEGTVHHNRLRLGDLNKRFPGLMGAILAQAPEEPSPKRAGDTGSARRRKSAVK